MILPSGSVLPSGLLEEETNHYAVFNSRYNNFSLKVGIVKEIYEIDDKNNASKETTEYDILVFEQNGDSAQTPIMYKNCITMDFFGGVTDFFEYKLRKQTKAEKKEKHGDKTPGMQNGSLVLLLCLNGFNENPVIVGGLRHPKRKTKLTKDAGHSLYGEFNGLSFSIDKDGAMSIGFKGATDNDGKPLDEKAGGAFLKIKKDGTVEINDGKKEKIILNKTDESLEAHSGKDMTLEAGKKVSVSAGGDMSIKSAKQLLIEAQGSANMKVKDLKIDSQGPVSLKGASLEANFSGMVKVKGSMITLDGNVFVGGAAGTPALVATTMFLGVGNLGIPVVSTAMGPYSSKVFIAP